MEGQQSSKSCARCSVRYKTNPLQFRFVYLFHQKVFKICYLFRECSGFQNIFLVFVKGERFHYAKKKSPMIDFNYIKFLDLKHIDFSNYRFDNTVC